MKNQIVISDYEYLSQLHSKLREVLSAFDALCRELGATFFLAYGTLLGAARHGDIIPWDDDVDVQMTRDNFQKLVDYFSKNKQYDSFGFSCLENNKNHFVFHGKFYSLERYSDSNFSNLLLAVDVFPLDYSDKMVSSKVKRKVLRASKISYSLFKLNSCKESVLKRMLRKVYVYPHQNETPHDHICFKTKSVICSNQSNYLTSFGGISKQEMLTVNSEDFQGSISALKLGGHSYKVPNNYKKHLSLIYGNNWYLPPKAKDIKGHKNEN